MCHMSPTWAHDAARFFAQLEEQNERAWWQANRAVYDTVIRPNFLGHLDGVGGFGPWRVYRPNNDTRFSPGKGPYKTFIGAVAERADGVGAFVQLSARGLLVGTGMPMPAPDQLQRLRAAIAASPSGEAFVAAADAARASGARVFGGRWAPLQRTPRGHPADHPRQEFLRWKGVELAHEPGLPPWLGRPGDSDRVVALVAQGAPLHDWLGAHVGASALSAEERFAPRRRSGAGR